MKLFKNIIFLLLATTTITTFTGCSASGKSFSKGTLLSEIPLSVWMWSNENFDPKLKPKLTSLGIQEVYLNTGWEEEAQAFEFKEQPIMYAIYIQSLKSSKIKAQALFGNNDWALSKNYEHMEGEVQTVLDFNKNYGPDFSAIHLDIEPHIFDDWEENKTTYLTEYLSNMTKLREKIDHHNMMNKDDIKISVDIPFWYSQDEFNVNNKNFVDQLLEIVDEIAVMNYTQNIDDFINWGINILKIADNHEGKTIKMGVEFLEEQEDITLFNFTKEELLDYVDDAVEAFKGYESFNGFAIHEYRSFSKYANSLK